MRVDRGSIVRSLAFGPYASGWISMDFDKTLMIIKCFNFHGNYRT